MYGNPFLVCHDRRVQKQFGAGLVESVTQPRADKLDAGCSTHPAQEIGSKLRSGHAEDTPQAAAEVEAVLRPVEIVTSDAIQPAGLRQYVQMARRVDAALRADLEGERVEAQHCRVLSPRLEVPVMAEDREPMLARMTRRFEDSEANTGPRLRGEQRRDRVTRRRATTGVWK